MITSILEKYAHENNIALSKDMLNQFEAYARLLLEWNEKINLTAITEPNEIATKHFLDSLLLTCAMEIPDNSSFIDIGSGAGFPGVALKIARPDIKLTLLDSLKKRTVFLNELSALLKQENKIVHARAEEYGRDAEYREMYDFAAARAVAALPALCEYCLPFVKPGGIFIALKGPDAAREAEAAENALSLLSGEISSIKYFKLPPDGTRGLIIIKKISHISTKYPRAAVKITKTPL